ncbi:MAG: NTP transferase domain-containing protein, partial [Bdellovibrionales bacterium]|nr:NTP transferase domain-containing protein [Bdellovibrionales bacterium]
MKIVAIVQARMGSTRLPNKVMKLINSVPMIELLLARLSRAKELDQIIVATSKNINNIPLIEHVRKLGYSCEQGSENDVLDRFIVAAKEHKADVVVRITGDCPLVDPELVDACVRHFRATNIDYFSNVNPPSYPDGLDVEVVTLLALEQSMRESDKLFNREHVTPYIRESGKFKTAVMQNETDLSLLRWTVDDPTDFTVITNVFRHFAPNLHFTWQEVLVLQDNYPELFSLNQSTTRNEGSTMGTGQKLWKRAKQVIAGGNMLLSKRPEMFLPDHWPAYFTKAKGCMVWDLDGNRFVDMSIMGIGTN